MLGTIRNGDGLADFLKSLPPLSQYEESVLRKWVDRLNGEMEQACLSVFHLEESLFVHQNAPINYPGVVELTSERMCRWVQDRLPKFQEIITELRQNSGQLSYSQGTAEYDKILRHIVDKAMRNGNRA